MAILVPCSCGKKLRVKDEMVGKRIKCPACGEILTAPVPQAAEPAVQRIEPRTARKVSQAERLPPSREREEEPFFWVDTTALGGQIIALSDEALFVADLNEKEFQRAQKALNKGAAIDEVLAEPKILIPYDQMQKVESNLHHRFIDVTWQEPEAKEETQTNLLCAAKEARDEIMAALHGRLGWKRQLIEFSRLRAAWGPLVVIVLFGFITVCFVLATLHQSTDSGGTKVVRTNWLGAIFVWVFNIFGPVGAALLGAPFVLAGVIWLVMRMVNPPLMLTLAPRRAERSRKGK